MIAMNHVAMVFPLQETTPLIQMRENEPQSYIALASPHRARVFEYLFRII